MTISRGMKAKMTRVRNEIKASLDTPIDQTSEQIFDALVSGEKYIEITYHEEEESFTLDYDRVEMAEELISVIKPKEMAHFVKEQTPENYNRLLNGIFTSVIYHIVALKYETEIREFHADYILELFMVIMYCDEDLQRTAVQAYNHYRQTDDGSEISQEAKRFQYSKTLLPLLSHVLQHRTSLGIELVNPVELDQPIDPLYKAAIDHLENPDEETFERLIMDLCDHHLEHSKDNYFLDFNHYNWQYWPVEILYLLKEHQAQGLSIDHIKHPLIDDFIPFLNTSFKLSELNQQALNQFLDG